MVASAEEPVVAGSILERTEKDAETLDWLSIPADQRTIDDKSMRTKLLVVVCLEVRIPSNSWQAQPVKSLSILFSALKNASSNNRLFCTSSHSST